jgi:hypothetical protein
VRLLAGVHAEVQLQGRRVRERSGTDVKILKIFSPKKIAKKLAFLTQNKAKF